MIENYRPVANLCSASKVFERLILNRINQLIKLKCYHIYCMQVDEYNLFAAMFMPIFVLNFL